MNEKSCHNCAAVNVCAIRESAIRSHERCAAATLHEHPLLPIVGIGNGDERLVDRVNGLRSKLIIAAGAIIGSACQHYVRALE